MAHEGKIAAGVGIAYAVVGLAAWLLSRPPSVAPPSSGDGTSSTPPTGCVECASLGLPCDPTTGQCLQGPPAPCQCPPGVPCYPAPPPPATCPTGYVTFGGCCVNYSRYPFVPSPNGAT